MLYTVKRRTAAAARRAKGIAIFLFASGVMLTALLLFYAGVKPIVSSIAESQVESVVMKAINDAAITVLTENALDYGSVVKLTRDDTGKVVSLTTDSVIMNIFKSLLINEVVKNVNLYGQNSVKIPIGSIISPTLLSGHGPSIDFDLLPVSSVQADFENCFDEAGINQTRHRIIVNIVIGAGVYLPGYSAETVVESGIIVAETVIVGAVPNDFTRFSGGGADEYLYTENT